MKPLITYIVPTYNSEKYIRNCLNSIIVQTFTNFEIIVINDGSTDNTLEILESFVYDRRIKVFSQENKGLSEARNKGLFLAKGKFVIFVDSDDTIDKMMAEDYINIQLINKSDIICSPHKRTDSNSNVTISAYPNVKDKMHLVMNSSFSASVCGKLIKLELFKKNGITFPKNKYYEDQLTIVELFYYAKNVFIEKKSYYNYNIIDNSITNSINQKKISDIISVPKDIFRFLNQVNIAYDFKIEILYKFIKLCNVYILKYLNQDSNEKLVSCFLQNIKTIAFFNEENLNIMKKTYISEYLVFLSYLKNIIPEKLKKEFLSDHIYQDLKLIKNKSRKYFHEEVIHFLKKNNIKDIICYGAGKIFNEISSSLKKSNINILGIIDKNQSQLQKEDINFISLDSLALNENRYIFICSIAFADEIRAELTDYIIQKKLNTKIIDISTVYGFRNL